MSVFIRTLIFATISVLTAGHPQSLMAADTTPISAMIQDILSESTESATSAASFEAPSPFIFGSPLARGVSVSPASSTAVFHSPLAAGTSISPTAPRATPLLPASPTADDTADHELATLLAATQITKKGSYRTPSRQLDNPLLESKSFKENTAPIKDAKNPVVKRSFADTHAHASAFKRVSRSTSIMGQPDSARTLRKIEPSAQPLSLPLPPANTATTTAAARAAAATKTG